MWHLSYGQVAAAEHAAWRAQVAAERLAAQAGTSDARRRHPVRRVVGELFIRIGARLVMPAAPSTSTVR